MDLRLSTPPSPVSSAALLSPRLVSRPLMWCWHGCRSDLCWECRESFLFQQQRDLREYTQATVYIRKVVEDKRVWTWAIGALHQVLLQDWGWHFVSYADGKGGSARTDGQQLRGRRREGRTCKGRWRGRSRLRPGTYCGHYNPSV